MNHICNTCKYRAECPAPYSRHAAACADLERERGAREANVKPIRWTRQDTVYAEQDIDYMGRSWHRTRRFRL